MVIIQSAIIQLCKHVVAKVTLVPCSVNLTGKRDKVGHGEVTINNARIINEPLLAFFKSYPCTGPRLSNDCWFG